MDGNSGGAGELPGIVEAGRGERVAQQHGPLIALMHL